MRAMAARSKYSCFLHLATPKNLAQRSRTPRSLGGAVTPRSILLQLLGSTPRSEQHCRRVNCFAMRSCLINSPKFISITIHNHSRCGVNYTTHPIVPSAFFPAFDDLREYMTGVQQHYFRHCPKPSRYLGFVARSLTPLSMQPMKSPIRSYRLGPSADRPTAGEGSAFSSAAHTSWAGGTCVCALVAYLTAAAAAAISSSIWRMDRSIQPWPLPGP